MIGSKRQRLLIGGLSIVLVSYGLDTVGVLPSPRAASGEGRSNPEADVSPEPQAPDLASLSAALRADPERTQIEPLSHNPFTARAEREAQIAEESAVAESQVVESDVEAASVTAALDAFTRQHQLTGILHGAAATAVVSDEVLSVGDRLGAFELAEIGSDFVRFTYRDQSVRLQLDR